MENKQMINNSAKLIFKIGLISIAAIFLVSSIIISLNLLNLCESFDSYFDISNMANIVSGYTPTVIASLVLNIIFWLLCIILIVFSITLMFKKLRSEKFLTITIIVSLIFTGVVLLAFYVQNSEILKEYVYYYELEYSNQISMDLVLDYAYYMPSILNSFTLMFLSYLMLTIQALIGNKNKNNDNDSVSEGKELNAENDIFAETRRELEAEIAEQKQKQKLFELQKELNEIRLQNEKYIKNDNELG